MCYADYHSLAALMVKIKKLLKPSVSDFKKPINTACETERDIHASENEHPPTCKKIKIESLWPTADT